MTIAKLSSLMLVTLAVMGYAASLRVDSVTVDSIWNSDSSWAGGSQSRVSRDCLLRFLPVGTGVARCTVAVSFDGGSSWLKPRDSVSAIALPTGSLYRCGQVAELRLRFKGGDRQAVAFKVAGRQLKPDVDVGPSGILVGSFVAASAAGKDTSVTIRCTPKTLDRAAAGTAKVYWDFDGDGVFADSTDSLFAVWRPASSTGAAGERRMLFVKVRDLNGLWSDPDTVVAAYGLSRSVAMASIAGGSFTMGNDAGRDNEKPAHQVTLSPFKLMTTDVTAEFYDLFMGYRPPAAGDTSLCPAVNMTWFDVVLFCNLASKRMGLDTCYTYSSLFMNGRSCGLMNDVACDRTRKGFRLPTEAEWEYAARGGSTTRYSWGATVDTAYCWTVDNSPSRIRPVARKIPNAWGLYDMLGNVTMWVNDEFVGYTADAQVDPVGPDLNGGLQGQRGGSVFDVLGWGADGLTCSFRDNGIPALPYYYNGFRMAQTQ